MIDVISSICSSPWKEEKGKMFWNFLSTYYMNAMPRNPKTVKMEQNDVKINLDSADTKT